MDLNRVVALLVEERNLLDRAIANLERLSSKRAKRGFGTPRQKMELRRDGEAPTSGASNGIGID
jgi:hypothetical protein